MVRRSAFVRPSGGRSYRKWLVIGTEGRVTEPEYFTILRVLYPDSDCLLKPARTSSSNCSSPQEVLQSVERWISKNGPLKKSDEAWLVVDKDSWTREQLRELSDWVSEANEHRFGRGLALSDPKFEYWLLLHFEDTNAANSDDCTRQLKKHLPSYDKHIGDRDFSQQRIQLAISRARQRDGHSGGASTTVYKLVESFLS